MRDAPVIDVETVRVRLARRFGPEVAGWCAGLPALEMVAQAGRALVHTASPVVREAHSAFFDSRLDADSKRALATLLDRVLVALVAN